MSNERTIIDCNNHIAGAEIDHHSSANPIQQLESYKAALLQLSARVDLFSEEDFPYNTKEIAKTYLLAENGTGVLSGGILYVWAFTDPRHGTFAIIRPFRFRAEHRLRKMTMSLVRVRQRSRLTAHWSRSL